MYRKKVIWRFSCLLVCFALSFSLFAETIINGVVVDIHDGDTITFLNENNKNKKARLRLIGTDSPEIYFKGHTQGKAAEKARDYLRSLLPLNSKIAIKIHELEANDQHNRFLGQILYKGKDLNYEMVKSGWSVVYFIYPYDRSNVELYTKAAKEAFDSKRGLNSPEYSKEEIPYVFRVDRSGFAPTNYVGNMITKKVYRPEEAIKVPHYARVFFPQLEQALSEGFQAD